MASTGFKFGLVRPQPGGVIDASSYGSNVFQPLPKPTGTAPYRLDLLTVIGASAYNTIVKHQKMVFHTVGDTGGVVSPQDQILVADHLEAQFVSGGIDNPAFFYVLGDVVYYYGEDGNYNTQFYEPYKFYPSPIFAIPGNHDGDLDPTVKKNAASLFAFNKLFCSASPVTPPEAGDAVRSTMVQPNVYWTLTTPFANIIGLYTNVPEHGVVKADQQAWFVNELKAAGAQQGQKALIVTLHHPPYSMDTHHGASPAMQTLLNDSFKQSSVLPDMVLSGHVHNYQRFTQHNGGRDIPYIVAGAGGYYNLHLVDSPSATIVTPTNNIPFPNMTFASYNEDSHGFLRMTIDGAARTIKGEYFTVPTIRDNPKNGAVLFDSFVLDLKSHKVV